MQALNLTIQFTLAAVRIRWSVYGLVLLSGALMLTGCAAVTQNQSARLRPGMPLVEVNRTLQWVAPRASFRFSSGGKDYSAREYGLQTGIKDNWRYYQRPCPSGVDGSCSVNMPTAIIEPYFVVIDEASQTLAASGTLVQMLQDSDSGVQDVATGVAAAYGRQRLPSLPKSQEEAP